MALNNSNGLFAPSIIPNVQGILGTVASLSAQISSIPQSILNQVSLDTAALQNTLNAATSALTGFVSHLENQVANLIPNLSLAVGQLSLQMGLLNSGCSLPSAGNIGAPGTNPCDLMNKFFGSLMAGGATLVSAISGALATATSGLANILNAGNSALTGIAQSINSAIMTIPNIASSITNMIAAETSQLASALSDVLNQTIAASFFGMLQNPCTAPILIANATAETANYINNTLNDPEYAGS